MVDQLRRADSEVARDAAACYRRASCALERALMEAARAGAYALAIASPHLRISVTDVSASDEDGDGDDGEEDEGDSAPTSRKRPRPRPARAVYQPGGNGGGASPLGVDWSEPAQRHGPVLFFAHFADVAARETGVRVTVVAPRVPGGGYGAHAYHVAPDSAAPSTAAVGEGARLWPSRPTGPPAAARGAHPSGARLALACMLDAETGRARRLRPDELTAADPHHPVDLYFEWR